MMDIYLDYPMKGYYKKFKEAVKSGKNIQVTINNEKIKSNIMETLMDTETELKSTISVSDFFLRWVKLSNFIVGHNEALSAGYAITYKKDNGLLVVYENKKA